LAFTLEFVMDAFGHLKSIGARFLGAAGRRQFARKAKIRALAA
jgi:hypothetical protein